MSSFFSFAFTEKSGRTGLVVFTHLESFDLKDAGDHVYAKILENSSIRKIILIAPRLAESTLRSLVANARSGTDSVLSARFFQQLPLHFNTPFQAVTFSAAGVLTDISTGEPIAAELLQVIRRQGMTEIARKRDVVLTGSDKFHFVKPSGSHSKGFVRAANSLCCDSELSFISLWVLPYLKDRCEFHCDTGSIFSVVQQAYLLKCRLEQEVPRDLKIGSFGSWNGRSSHDFGQPGNSLILISATTSDSLAKAILKTSNVDLSQIVTLFGLNRLDSESAVLCNLLVDSSENPNGYDAIENAHNTRTCKLCIAGSVPVQMSGDSFLPKLPTENPHLIREGDIPEWLSDFLDRHQSSKLIGGFSFSRQPNPRDITFSFESIFSDPSVRFPGNLSIFDAFTGSVPAGIETIISLKSEGSAELACALQKFSHEVGRSNLVPQVVDIQAIAAGDVDLASLSGVTAICCGELMDSSELSSVSLLLRKSKTPLFYLIGILALPDQHEFVQIRRNLSKMRDGRSNPVSFLERVYIPFQAAYSSWRSELKLLPNLQWYARKMKSRDREWETWIGHRLDYLRSSSGSMMADSNLFLPSPTGHALGLRPNTVFVKFDTQPRPLDQAQVFFAVSATLHRIRHYEGSFANLKRAFGNQLLLSAQNFQRYNDGVIQAAILRASLPGELNYSGNQSESREVGALIVSFVENRENDASEALNEFLLAMCLGKLVLHEDDLSKVRRKLRSKINELLPLTRGLTRSLPAKTGAS